MKRLPSFMLLAALMLPLAACSASDTEAVTSFIMDWMTNKGVLDADGTPTVKAGLVATGWGTTGDDQADAAVQGGMVIKNMKDADKLSDEAGNAFYSVPRDSKTALEKMNAAINMRPGDWSYYNRRAMIHATMGNDAEAQKDRRAAQDACEGNQHCLNRVEADLNELIADDFEGGGR